MVSIEVVPLCRPWPCSSIASPWMHRNISHWYNFIILLFLLLILFYETKPVKYKHATKLKCLIILMVFYRDSSQAYRDGVLLVFLLQRSMSWHSISWTLHLLQLVVVLSWSSGCCRLWGLHKVELWLLRLPVVVLLQTGTGWRLCGLHTVLLLRREVVLHHISPSCRLRRRHVELRHLLLLALQLAVMWDRALRWRECLWVLALVVLQLAVNGYK